MAVPQWAQELTINALIHAGCDDVPNITWRRCNRWDSSGVCNTTKREDGIVINAGRDRTDQKLVLLHELAHWIRPPKEHHSPEFWDLAWELFRWAKLPVRYCLQRERTYRKGAVLAYKRSK